MVYEVDKNELLSLHFLYMCEISILFFFFSRILLQNTIENQPERNKNNYTGKDSGSRCPQVFLCSALK
jgi:hypothetical protein